MKETPMLMTGQNVLAVLSGRKTQTRRLVLKNGTDADYNLVGLSDNRAHFRANRKPKRGELLMPDFGVNCHYGGPGDALWFKETWRTRREWNSIKPTELPIDISHRANWPWLREEYICYDAGPTEPVILTGKTRPSLFMRRWMSRAGGVLKSVRIERLQDISPADAIAEGLVSDEFPIGGEYVRKYGLLGWQHHWFRQSPVDAYQRIWEDINGKGSWEINPWTWVLEFEPTI